MRYRMKKTMQPTYAMAVLGCKANQYDAEQVREVLEAAGLRPVPPREQPDLIVVHTCAVTAEAARKSRQALRRLQGRHPGAQAILTGCAGAVPGFQVPPGVAACIPPGPDWPLRLGRALAELPIPLRPAGIPTSADALTLSRFAGHARAFLKIQDGCNIGCSYCIVPALRGPPRDRPADTVVSEARDLAAAGHREIVVSGISVGLYGRSGSNGSLADLLRRLNEIPGIERLRLSSLHPEELTDGLLDVWASSPKMMPHLHLPFQSGSDRILQAMRRGYTAAQFLGAVDRARWKLEDPAITTDAIAGFPGESEEDFSRTIEVARQAGFSRMHVFPYSARPGTAAARLDGRVAFAAVKERARTLRDVAGDLALAFHRRFIGKTAQVLVEGWHPDGHVCEGHAERYFAVRFRGHGDLVGQIVSVRLMEASAEGLVAVMGGGSAVARASGPCLG